MECSKVVKMIRVAFLMWLIFQQAIMSALAQTNANIEEEVYLHLSSTQLLAGESLFYAAFVRSLQTGRPSQLSKLLYIDIVDQNVESVYQKKLSLEAGRGSGEFFVPSHLPTGKYVIVAYTRWMKNFKRYYQEELEIINPYLKYSPEPDSTARQWEISLTPEGGHLISGHPNKLIIASKDQYGKAVTATVTIQLEGQAPVELPTGCGGRVAINLSAADSIEKILLKSHLGSREVLNPAACAECYALTVQPSADMVQLSVRGIANPETPLQFQILSTNAVIRQESIQVGRPVVFRRDSLPAGLVRIKLLSSGLTQSERLFWNGATRIAPDSLRVFPANEVVNLAVDLSQVAHASISIAHESSAERQETMAIGHEIGQRIDQNETNAFFRNASAEDIDQFLITAKYEERLSPTIDFLPEFRSDLLEGQLVDLSGDPVTGASVGLSLAGSPTQIDYGKTDSLGFFLLDLKFMDRVYEATFNVISPENRLYDQRSNEVQEERFVISEQEDAYQLKLKLLDFEGKPIKNATLKMGVEEADDVLTYQTDDEGFVTFNLDVLDRLDRAAYELVSQELLSEEEDNQNKDFVVKGGSIVKTSVLEIESRYQIKVFDEFIALPDVVLEPVQLTAEKLADVERRSIHSQIENAYFFSDSIYETVNYSLPQFEVFQSYNLDEFTRFPSLRDTFIEFVSGVRVSKDQDKHKVKMWNAEWIEDFNVATANSVYLLNGRFITSEELLKTSPYLIERVDVIDRQFVFGSIVFNGVISLSTFDLEQTTKPSNLDYDFIPSSAAQTTLNDGMLKSNNKRLPDFRELLYWNPNFSGKEEISFKTSSVTGLYTVRVEGVDQSGEPVSKAFIIEVAP